jgi:hypothetical protein
MRAIASLGCEGAMRAIASSMTPNVPPPRQGTKPILCAATAGGRTTVQTYVSSAAFTANDPNSLKVNRRKGQGLLYR